MHHYTTAGFEFAADVALTILLTRGLTIRAFHYRLAEPVGYPTQTVTGQYPPGSHIQFIFLQKILFYTQTRLGFPSVFFLYIIIMSGVFQIKIKSIILVRRL